ncbi:hypothetical protein GTCCBUS3UF5_18380 [Geobacillus thermoleovorans CCB_US3_UF5]|uniref:Uncharacterized protein n=1 Tax=Geobacillus thermoleovorans CCB_US3_UF5 TaxID=1111068 RepID=A0ABN4A076_GEOTH|nr:hypothetical protein GTCCBUS3UF5_18380 [Geobacillus thermoleovorans CCB_US3_UF5]
MTIQKKSNICRRRNALYIIKRSENEPIADQKGWFDDVDISRH